MVELITSNYTNVIFDLALEENHLEEIGAELEDISRILHNIPDYMLFLTGPQIAKEEKIHSVDKVFDGKILETTKNFIKVLIENGRIEYLLEIAKCYKNLQREHQGIVLVEAITSVPMDENQKQTLTEKLETKLRQKIELDNIVDPSIIGGMKIRIGEKSVDASLGNRLRDLRAELVK